MTRIAEYLKVRYYNRREYWIEQLGGKCADCGSIDDLEFDHIDPKIKSFDIAKRLATGSYERLKPEFDKCQLLCHDCHVDKSVAEKAVEHGGGLTGKRNCYCDLCAPLKRKYNKEFQRKKRTPMRTVTKEEPQHGERRRYTGKWKCRCDLCKEAQRLYMVQYR